MFITHSTAPEKGKQAYRYFVINYRHRAANSTQSRDDCYLSPDRLRHRLSICAQFVRIFRLASLMTLRSLKIFSPRSAGYGLVGPSPLRLAKNCDLSGTTRPRLRPSMARSE